MINFGDNSFIKYTYSATGEKLGVEYGVRLQPVLSPTGQDATMSENGDADGTMRDRSGGFDPGPLVPMAMDGITYCGNVVYDGNDARLLTDEGYVTFTATGTPQYHYYLRDHLGNIRVVMGQTGALEQVNHYYAFGGLMRESTNPGVQPYKFGGKELDRTSGLDAYDFGARMYFADRMQWGTMDPMCEKYYDVTPYGYCGNRPVNAIDPDGKDEWEINSEGFLIRRVEKNEYDGFFFVDNDGNRIEGKSLIFDYGTVLSHSLRGCDDENKFDIYELKGTPLTKELFTFLADNSSVEWNLATGGWVASAADIHYLTTSHSENTEVGIIYLIETQLSKGYNLLHLYHNHPKGTTFPSGLGYGILSGLGKGDKQHAEDITRLFGNNVRFSIYSSNKKQFISYGPNSSISDFPEFWIYHGNK